MVWTKLGLTKQRMRKWEPKKLTGLHLSKRHYLIAGGAVLLTAALASSAVAKWGHSTDPVTVPEHTRIHVVLDQAVSTGTKPGHHFRATVSKPVVIEGKTRSEERRVGKECRYRWERYNKRKKKNSEHGSRHRKQQGTSEG